MANNYDFHDEWNITVPLDIAWEAISDSADWERWWPGLKSATITHHDPKIIGSSVELIWRSKTGYHLRHRITITAIKPKHWIEFQSEGDLKGYGSWQFESKDNKTYMIIDWHVKTTKRWMNLFGVFLRPIFLHNHHSLMNRGESGLNRYLSDVDD